MDCQIIESNLDAIRALARAAIAAIGNGDNTTCRARVKAMRDALDAVEEQLDTPMPIPRGWERVA